MTLDMITYQKHNAWILLPNQNRKIERKKVSIIMETTLPKQSSQRVYQWDNLKFLLIFLVVFGHFFERLTDTSQLAQQLYIYVWSFHMPAFLFVSGIFSKKNINEKRYRKIFEYFILYLFIQLSLFIVEVITSDTTTYSIVKEDGVPWYAFALFVCSLITIALKNLDRKYLFCFAIVLGCFSGYNTALNDIFVSSRIVVYYPFFLAGYYLDGNKIINVLSKTWIKISALFIHLVWIGLIYLFPVATYKLRPLITGRAHFEKIGMHYCFYRGIYYVAVFILIFAIITLIPNIKNICSTWGSRSVQVYALHRGFIYIFYNVFHGQDFLEKVSDVKAQLILMSLSAILTVILSLGIWTKPLNFILKPKWNNE